MSVVHFDQPQLELDPLAAWFVKDELVTVRFADDAGELLSREGPNKFVAGDALITGSTGDRWSVTRVRFDAKYAAVPPLQHGNNGVYRSRPISVLARQIHAVFTVARRAGGDVLTGNAGDWLLQYAPGDYGLVEAARFRSVYQPCPPPPHTS